MPFPNGPDEGEGCAGLFSLEGNWRADRTVSTPEPVHDHREHDDGGAFNASIPVDAPGFVIQACIAAGVLATGLTILPALVLAYTAGPATIRDSSSEFPPSGTGTELPAEAAVELQW